MKNLCWLLLAGFFATTAKAQTIIEKHLDFTQKKSVRMNIQIADSIRIIPWDKNEVYLHASVNINDNKDNDKYRWTFDNSSSDVEIDSKLDDEKGSWSRNGKDCCCWQSEVYCVVYVPASAGYSIESINGDLILTGHAPNIKAKTISGFIDLTASPDLKADMEFKTITGIVYTNFALNVAGDGHSGPTDFTSSLNGGGVPINLETISGNIYFRKAD